MSNEHTPSCAALIISDPVGAFWYDPTDLPGYKRQFLPSLGESTPNASWICFTSGNVSVTPIAVKPMEPATCHKRPKRREQVGSTPRVYRSRLLTQTSQMAVAGVGKLADARVNLDSYRHPFAFRDGNLNRGVDRQRRGRKALDRFPARLHGLNRVRTG